MPLWTQNPYILVCLELPGGPCTSDDQCAPVFTGFTPHCVDGACVPF
jgi:hypothetical protein